uniref:Neur_chan_memb domain-containing protein n=1 Tax=Caenorhabditis tropicalis TaxID=1561998 RepID=A0A1I7TBR4_9PELO
MATAYRSSEAFLPTDDSSRLNMDIISFFSAVFGFWTVFFTFWFTFHFANGWEDPDGEILDWRLERHRRAKARRERRRRRNQS